MLVAVAAGAARLLPPAGKTFWSCRFAARGCHSIPVIRIPRRMQLRAELTGARKQKKQQPQKLQVPRAGKLLIVSKRAGLNQHSRQTVGKFQRPVLVSQGWKHRLSFGDHFLINNTWQRAPFVQEQEAVTFQALGLLPELVEALRASHITHPTTVQLQIIPPILRGKNLLCAAETGSGKTLSYLLPVMHRLKTEKPKIEATIGPRNVILVPSRELSEQVKNVAKSLGHGLGLSVTAVGGGRGINRVEKQLLKGCSDILVATPGALWKALKRNMVHLDNVRHFVMDEADTLFDESFIELVEDILLQTKLSSSVHDQSDLEGNTQLVVVGATFPNGVGELLSKVTDLGSITTVTSKRLHCLMPHIKQKFLKLKGVNKMAELLQIIKEQSAAKPGSGILVFCNSASTVNWLGYMLDDHNIKHLRLQGQMPAAMRAGIFDTFQKSLTDVLVCTDIASRGLDSRRVELVINYDFPPTLQDYIHRAGRVGRMGSEAHCIVVSFVTHLWDVELVQKIEIAARKRISLPGMETSIKSPIPKTNLTYSNSEPEVLN
ncbi:probable ATP-dependent RNA helicase DDX28 [Rhinatrema bivittatum]|uniref:probable ATP-dependent RNA helicase DDX28 n=1 Tax=Rhinatrema bivittatum TaxID=194408 RepID=UPI0011280030|nr:probable ATP-dependent RNA helicase DDX28 [Rhinatrema bivittatum]